MALRLIQFLAIMLTALALVPSRAHLAALPNKIAMAQTAYFVCPADLYWIGFLRCCPVWRFGSGFDAHNRAAQAGPIIQLCAQLIFAGCCYPRYLLRLDLPDLLSQGPRWRCPAEGDERD